MEQPNLMTSQPYGILRIVGAAAASYLQGQLTCDINTISERTASYTAYCNRQGKMHTFGLLYRHAHHEFYLFIPHELHSSICTNLQKFIVQADVKLEDLSNTHHLMINHPLNQVFSEQCLLKFKIPYCSDVELLLMPGPSTLIHPEQWDRFWVNAGIVQCNLSDTLEFNPLELNALAFQAVSLKKGCYLGQEIINRLYHLAKPQRAFGLCSSLQSLKSYSPLYNEQQEPAGHLFNTALDGHQHGIALGVLELKAKDNAQPLYALSTSSERIAVTFQDKTFS